ncbi:hypothetical protein GCM10007160_20550 [Litchfieldella qijiaojingensis]|uniref:DUF4194 domain-containing protein n=1 Tax=Litchfieldella qijiaojingensis TaxID=980347 RepID=A0ABQ2YSZ3_9GAMM|nr:hypothetical protein [Halomonas qijiaojingensis]GGX92906.1 hypothetical protein GCM10007160_20550 [Halomonas qijiaojingensis]
MNMTEMGEVVAYLLRYRTAERQPSGGRKRRAAREGQLSERDVCALIDDALETEREALRDFLAGQGLRLRVFEPGDYPGIVPGSRLYALVPDPELDQPPLYTRDPVFDALRLRQESRAELAQWYLQLWLLLHTLLYTRLNRALSDVSRYQEATFATTELVELVREQLESLRALGDAAPDASRVLLDERGEDVSRRVKAFIELQLRAGHLEAVRETTDEGGDIWQQTLLGALEAEQVGVHHLSHLVELLSGQEDAPAAKEAPDTTPEDSPPTAGNSEVGGIADATQEADLFGGADSEVGGEGSCEEDAEALEETGGRA